MKKTVSVCTRQGLYPVPSLWDGMCRIYPGMAYKKNGPPVLAFTGSGGKTSWIYALAEELRRQRRKVLIVTTTHMYAPVRWGVTEARTDAVLNQLEREGIAVAGIPDGSGKISFIGDAVYTASCKAAEVVLVEADGSRRLPLKIMGVHEPVIPPQTDAILAFAGLQALGQPVQDVCFRWQEQKLDPQSVVTMPVFARIWQTGCLDILQKTYAAGIVKIVPVLHQADTPQLRHQARHILAAAGADQGLVTSFRPQV